jgi:hypothetical protein
VRTALNGVTNLDVTLDAIGNITYRSDVGAYTYHATRKHALASTGAPSNWSFTYDPQPTPSRVFVLPCW